MPWASEKQRAWMFATKPAMARRWAAEEKKAAPISPKSYLELIARGLTGISDQVLRDHVGLYHAYCTELAMLDDARPPAWRQPPVTLPGLDLQLLLNSPVCSLPLAIEGQLAEAVAQVEAELAAKGIAWRPLWYLGDADFWTADQAVSINLPWFLANDTLWQLVNEQDARYSRDDVVRILRHEVGHALGYAFELWKEGLWKVTFGDFFQPYTDSYTPDPTNTAFVRHLHLLPSSPQAHYAQKHPDEDWAETFAVWLDPGSRWREAYAGTDALPKLEAVQTLLVDWGRTYGPPINRRIGRTVPFTSLAYTVGDYLGVRTGPDPYDDLLRRLPEVYSAIVLHEHYFDGLARGSAPAAVAAPTFSQLAAAAFGDVNAWAADLRTAARAATGWVLTVWDRRDARVRNVLVAGHSQGVPPNADILLALDLHEHAYAGDVATRKDIYVGAWWRNINWTAVELRARGTIPPALPQPWGVTYAAPNVDRSRKACVNCRFAIRGATRCAIVAAPIAPDMVCGYHVEFDQRMTAESAGLELVPGGTSCDCCRFYSPVTDTSGNCAGVAGPAGRPPAQVDGRGCCARWEPNGLVQIGLPTPEVPTAPVAELAAVAVSEPAGAIANARILPTP